MVFVSCKWLTRSWIQSSLRRPRTFVKRDEAGVTKAAVGVHVDDSIMIGEEKIINEVHQKIKNKFTYGSNDKIPCIYIGTHMKKDGKNDNCQA